MVCGAKGRPSTESVMRNITAIYDGLRWGRHLLVYICLSIIDEGDRISAPGVEGTGVVTRGVPLPLSPVKDNLSIKVVRAAASKIGITIHNAAGQIVYYSTTQQAAGQTIYSIPMKKMSDGAYFVTVRVNDKKEKVKKIMRQ